MFCLFVFAHRLLSFAQQRIIGAPAGGVTTENNTGEALSLGPLNNQENLQPGETGNVQPPTADKQRSPLQAAQHLDKEAVGAVGGTSTTTTGPAAASSGANVNGTGVPSSPADPTKSPKKRRMEEGNEPDGGPPPQQPTHQEARRVQVAQVATPDSLADTERMDNYRAGGAAERNDDADSAAGFAPLAASASMPAVMMAMSGHHYQRGLFTPSHSVPQTPVGGGDADGVSATTGSTALAGSGAAGVVTVGSPAGGVRGRTNLRRFHSMNAHNNNHSPGNSRGSGVRLTPRDKDRDRERERERDRDTSYTQCALADDDNISAFQQMTRAGGGESTIGIEK